MNWTGDTGGCNKPKEFATRGGEYLYERTATSMSPDTGPQQPIREMAYHGSSFNPPA